MNSGRKDFWEILSESSSRNSVCEQSAFGKEKGWVQQVCHQFEKFRSICLPSSFWNRVVSVVNKRHSEAACRMNIFASHPQMN